VREALCFGWIDSLVRRLDDERYAIKVTPRKPMRPNLAAWRQFQALAPSHRRQYALWIHTARRPETRARRIRESIRLLSAGSTLGLK
jgi:uncharacterized protein YdeI (YjbR/CyaY-like superfamily)